MHWRVPVHAIGACAAGLCAYAAFLLALAPATLLDAGVQRATEGRVRLAEAQGTFWFGAGQIEIRDAAGRRGVGRPLSWQFQPQSLLRGSLGFEIDIAGAGKSFPLSLFLSRLEISNVQIALPAAALGVAVPRLALIGPTGDLFFRTSNFSFARGAVSGNAIVEWRSAGSDLTPVSPLGDYELRLVGGSGGVSASLRTLKGPLYLEGKGLRANNGPPTFSATARIDPQLLPQLAPFLRLIAIERGQGVFELQLNPNIGLVPQVPPSPVRQ